LTGGDLRYGAFRDGGNNMLVLLEFFEEVSISVEVFVI
jgi:hypothetical protein